MTRISSLFVASALAVLPISAFAQQSTAPAKSTAPTTTTTTAAPTTTMAPATTAPTSTAPATGSVAGKSAPATTADVTKPAKPEVKAPASGAKSEVHGMNSVKTHHAKTNAPAKTAEPSKS